MTRSIPWRWLALIALLLLLPSAMGRFLLDLLGGITLLLLLLPLLAALFAWIGWQLLRSRLITCQSCGLTSFGQESCPACGTPLTRPQRSGPPVPEDREIDASTAIVTVTATDVLPNDA